MKYQERQISEFLRFRLFVVQKHDFDWKKEMGFPLTTEAKIEVLEGYETINRILFRIISEPVTEDNRFW